VFNVALLTDLRKMIVLIAGLSFFAVFSPHTPADSIAEEASVENNI